MSEPEILVTEGIENTEDGRILVDGRELPPGTYTLKFPDSTSTGTLCVASQED